MSTLFGAAQGAVVSLAGFSLLTIVYGAILGTLAGLLVSPIVSACVKHRDRRKACDALFWPALGWAFVIGPVTRVGYGVIDFALGPIKVPPGAVTLWFMLLPIVAYLATAASVRRKLPVVWPPLREGECDTCGYSLAGLEVATCPECGKAVRVKRTSATAISRSRL